MTPAEMSRLDYRFAMLQRRGMPPMQAAELAHDLFERDTCRDDRRMCLECKNWQRSRTCSLGLPALPLTLQRCPRFKWQTPA